MEESAQASSWQQFRGSTAATSSMELAQERQESTGTRDSGRASVGLKRAHRSYKRCFSCYVDLHCRMFERLIFRQLTRNAQSSWGLTQNQ